MNSPANSGADAARRAGAGTAVHRLRQQLIDVGKRNRLTNAPVGKGRARRMSRLWGYKRCGKRIQEAVESAVRTAALQGLIRYADDGRRQFLERLEGVAPVVVRDRSNAGSTLRDKDMLPPAEIEAAVQRVVESNIGIGAGDCAVEVARLFGFKSTSADLRQHFETHAREMVSQGRLTVLDGHLRLP